LKKEQDLIGGKPPIGRNFNPSQKVAFGDKDFMFSEAGNTDNTSVVSTHYTKSKSIYKLKKIFNKNCLKTWFDIFVIKLF
jgi:hypothetical protein